MGEARQADHYGAFIQRSTKLLQRNLEAFVAAQEAVLNTIGDEAAFYRAAREFEEAHQRFAAHLQRLAKGDTSPPLPSGWVHKSGALPVVPACVAAAGDAARLRYLAFFSDTKWTQGVLRSYRSTVESFMAWCEAQGLASIADLDASLTSRYVDHLRAGLTTNTLNGRRSILSRYLSWMVQGGILPDGCLLGFKLRS